VDIKWLGVAIAWLGAAYMLAGPILYMKKNITGLTAFGFCAAGVMLTFAASKIIFNLH